MPLTKKVQILAKAEFSEGVKATGLGAANARLVFDPAISDTVSRSDRIPASAALGRRKDQVGRGSRQLTFGMDYAGTGDTSAPFDKPPWAEFIRAAGMKEVAVKAFAMTLVTGTYFQGEKIYKSGSEGTEYGIALNGTTGATALLQVAWLVGSAGAGTYVGKNSGASGTAAAPAATDQWFYRPHSQKEQAVTNGAWSAGPTLAVGDVLQIQRGGVIVGAAQIIADSGGFTAMTLALQWGSVLDADTLVSAAGETALIDADPVQTEIPSLTVSHNLDGFIRDLVGCRANFTITAEAGGPGLFNFTIDGTNSSESDALFATGIALSTIIPPRFLGVAAFIGVGASQIQIPIRSVEYDHGGVVGLRADANQPTGDRAAEFSDRDPTLTIGTDLAGKSAVDWFGLRDAGTGVRFSIRVGAAGGNILTLCGPECQVGELGDEDAEGVAGFTIGLKPRFMDDGMITEEGDNEIIIALTSSAAG